MVDKHLARNGILGCTLLFGLSVWLLLPDATVEVEDAEAAIVKRAVAMYQHEFGRPPVSFTHAVDVLKSNYSTMEFAVHIVSETKYDLRIENHGRKRHYEVTYDFDPEQDQVIAFDIRTVVD